MYSVPVVSLLLLVSLAAAVNAAPMQPNEDVLGQIYSMSSVAVMLMLLLTAFAYFAASLIRRPEWEAFAKLELFQVAVSVLLLVFAIGLANYAYATVAAFAGDDPFGIANQFLEFVLFGGDASGFMGAVPTLAKLHSSELVAQYLGGMVRKIGPAAGWGIVAPVFPVARIVESSISFTIMIMTPITGSLLAQRIGLQVLQATMFTLVLPVGLFLRIFPPTRNAGVFFIAAAVGFYVIFPATYVMHDAVTRHLLADPGMYEWIEVSAGEQTAVHSAVPNSPVDQFRASLGVAGSQVGLGVETFQGFLNPKDVLFYPLQSLGFAVMVATALPALSMIITTTFIVSLTKFLTQKLE